MYNDIKLAEIKLHACRSVKVSALATTSYMMAVNFSTLCTVL